MPREFKGDLSAFDLNRHLRSPSTNMSQSTLHRPLDLAHLSVPELGDLHRLLYHASLANARALAGYCPLVSPLPAKWALIETVYALVEHSVLYATRLPEVRGPLRLAGVPSEEIRRGATALCEQRSWEQALGWVGHHLLPDLLKLSEEALSSANGQALMHDRQIFTQVCADLRRLCAMPAFESLPSDAQMPTLALEQIPPMEAGPTPTGAFALQSPPCPKRVYPSESRFTSESVKAPNPDTPERLAAFLHNNLQIEFIAIDVPMRNLADFHDMPLQFYRDMGRHAHDEMRHTILLLENLDALDMPLGHFPFESPDRFQALVDQDLLYRLVVLSRAGEGEAIEFARSLVPNLATLGFHEASHMFDHVVSDEIRHTAYANKWIRFIVGDDDQAVEDVTRDCLLRYNSIAQEIGLPGKPRVPDLLNADRPLGVDLLGRELAGFTKGELESLSRAAKK
jgi:uncharacterized ferritin-like protein (DUF455 family)